MRDVEQVFFDAIVNESYVRALTDDFSVVDLVAKESGDVNEEEH